MAGFEGSPAEAWVEIVRLMAASLCSMNLL
jgi:hypothetical protein